MYVCEPCRGFGFRCCENLICFRDEMLDLSKQDGCQKAKIACTHQSFAHDVTVSITTQERSFGS